MTNKEILELEFESTDLRKEITIRDFFKELSITLLKQRNALAWRKPFGNGRWHHDLCNCLAQNGIIDGECSDNCGFTVWNYDAEEAERKILELIKELWLLEA